MQDYKVVQDSNKDQFIKLVNTFLAEGYILIGGVNINYIATQYGVEIVYAQAIAIK